MSDKVFIGGDPTKEKYGGSCLGGKGTNMMVGKRGPTKGNASDMTTRPATKIDGGTKRPATSQLYTGKRGPTKGNQQ